MICSRRFPSKSLSSGFKPINISWNFDGKIVFRAEASGRPGAGAAPFTEGHLLENIIFVLDLCELQVHGLLEE